MSGHHPLLLTERDWQWWFGVDDAEAVRLVHVQRALLAAGIDPCPETVLGMSRAVLVDRLAPVRLRLLADLWDRRPAPGVLNEGSWSTADDLAVMPAHPHWVPGTDQTGGRRPHLCRRHSPPRRDGP